MSISIERNDVRRLQQAGARLVEVMSRSAYEEEHLPGAINIPLKDLAFEAHLRLRPDQLVIVYCHDFQ